MQVVGDCVLSFRILGFWLHCCFYFVFCNFYQIWVCVSTLETFFAFFITSILWSVFIIFENKGRVKNVKKLMGMLKIFFSWVYLISVLFPVFCFCLFFLNGFCRLEWQCWQNGQMDVWRGTLRILCVLIFKYVIFSAFSSPGNIFLNFFAILI